MAKSTSNIRVYNSATSGVWVAPRGTVLPTTLAAPAAPFAETGYLSEDGVTAGRDEDVKEFKALQGGVTVRRQSSGVKDTLKFVCLEETAITLGLYYKGATVTTASGVDTIQVTNQTRNDERAFVVDLVDGAITKRFCIPVGAVGTGEVVHSGEDMTAYEFEVTIIGDYTVLKTAAS